MKISKIISAASSILVVAIAILIVVSLYPVTGNYKIFVVQSGSMEPSIKTGGVVVSKPQDKYGIGDVITFKTSGGKLESVTHRIVGIENEGGKESFATKGDANNSEDKNRVAPEKIIGKVLFSVPYLGYAVAAARQPFGFLLVVIIPSGIIIVEEIGKIGKELKSRKPSSPESQ